MTRDRSGFILITGATGFVGSHLCRELASLGYRLRVLSTGLGGDMAVPAEVRRWTPPDYDFPAQTVEGAEAVFHLSGSSFWAWPWTRRKERDAWHSRVTTAERLVDAIMGSSKPPRLFVQASAIGVYGDRGNEELVETSPTGEGFYPRLVRAWEAPASELGLKGIRSVQMRFGVILGKDGGAFPIMRKAYHTHMAARVGKPSRWMSWIHLTDAVDLLKESLIRPHLSGVINAVAPEPANEERWHELLEQGIARQAPFRVPTLLVKSVMGRPSGLLFASQRVYPARALEAGYEYRYPTLEMAMDELLNEETPALVVPPADVAAHDL